MPKIKFEKTKKSLKNLPRTLAEKSFLTFLGFLFVVLFLGSGVFYYSYVFLTEISDETIKEEKLLKLNMESQQKVLEEWQKRNENFYAVDFKEYPDPFRIE
ncbi:MAG: hypothetical protein Q8N73_01710 [bacterium]|nr:hypothetical protein [bacterium]